MGNPEKYTYRLLLLTENKQLYNITDYVTDLGWEELEKELAVRISFTGKNDQTSQGRLSELIKPGCYLALVYDYDGGGSKEAVRGSVVEWNPQEKLSGEPFKVKAYDELYNLQESQDNIYFSEGASTKAVLTQIFSDWGIPVDKYEGADVTHGKLVYKAETLSTAILEILDEAKKKGGEETIIRAVQGKVQVISRGSNEKVYHFEENLISASYKMSTSGMITRVKVIGEEDDDGRSPLEATLNGQTEFGIRQKIYTRGTDESLEDAQKAAQEILDEDGDVQKDITVVAPDIPDVRKGDLVHLAAGILQGYCYVLGVRHDCGAMEMTLTLEEAKTEETSEEGSKKVYQVGDIVNFHGGTHYVSSYPDARGYSVAAGQAKITIMNGSGGAHPYHLVTTNWAQSHVYGWVDEGAFD